MASDARISVTFAAHPKTKKLIRRHGHPAGWGLVCLFLWTAANRPDGDLEGMTSEDIELAVDWAGDEGALVRALKDVGFLDGEDGGYSIHDWAEHNPWAAGAKDRSEASKFAALCKRYGREKAAEMMPDHAPRARPAPDADADRTANESGRDAASQNPQCPVTASATVSATVSKFPPKPPKGGVMRTADFEVAYQAYPLKVAPNKAAKAFANAMRTGVTLQAILDGIERYKKNKPEQQAWAHFATWLNDGRWQDAHGPVEGPAGDPEENLWKARLANWKPGKYWNHGMWGPSPDQPGCKAPKRLLESRQRVEMACAS